MQLRVEANYGGNGEFYPGVIDKVNDDGTYNIMYDDGDTEQDVAESLIRSAVASDEAPPTQARDDSDNNNDDDGDNKNANKAVVGASVGGENTTATAASNDDDAYGDDDVDFAQPSVIVNRGKDDADEEYDDDFS